MVVFDTGNHDGATATNALCIEVRVFLRHAGFDHRADDSADRPARNGTSCGCSTPAGSDHRPNTGSRTSQGKPIGPRTTGNGADTRSVALTFDVDAAIRFVSDDADVVRRDAGILKRLHCCLGVVVAIV